MRNVTLDSAGTKIKKKTFFQKISKSAPKQKGECLHALLYNSNIAYRIIF